jgi:hypothetical protein
MEDHWVTFFHSRAKPVSALESSRVVKTSEAGKWLSFNELKVPHKAKPVSGLESMGVWKIAEAVMWLLINKLEVGCWDAD